MAEAELSVVIKTEGAEEGASSLDKFSVSAKGAADATNDLSQAQQKYTNISGMAPRTPFASMFDDQGKIKTSATAWVNSFKSVQDNVTATGQSVSWFQRILNAFSFDHSLGSTRAFREVIQSLRPALYELGAVSGSAGSSIGGLGAYAGAARAGFVGLAAAITGALIVSLEKAGDSVNILRKRLDDIRGPEAGGRAFQDIKSAAEASSSSISNMATNVERLRSRMAELKLPAGFVFPDTELGRAGAAQLGGLESATNVLKTLSEAFQLSGKSATAADADIKKFLDSIAKTPFVTKDLFDLIYANSAKLGNAIVQAFGGQATEMGVAKFRANIDKSHILIQKLLQLISQVGPSVQQNFAEAPPNLVQSWDRLTTSIGNLWRTLGDARNGNIISSMFAGLENAIDRMEKKIAKGQGFWSGFWQLFTPPQGWFVMMGQAIDLIAKAAGYAPKSGSILNSLQSGYDKAIAASQRAAQEIRDAWQQPIINANSITSAVDLINSALGTLDTKGRVSVAGLATVWQQLDAAMWKVAQDAVIAGNQMLTAWNNALMGMKATQQQFGTGNTFGGGPSFVYPGGGGTGTGGGGLVGTGYVSPSSNPYAYQTAGGVFSMGTFYPNKAHGGAFQVSGPGGTDSVPVQFMATPGEVVTITPSNLTSPSNMAGMVTANLPAAALSQGAGAITNAAPAKAITDPITFAVKDSSGKIVGAVNDATAAIKSMAENAARAAEAAGGGAIGGATGGIAGGYTYSGKAGSAAGPLGSGPIDAYGYIVPSTQRVYISRINYNSAIAGMPQGPGNPVYTINPNYRGAAEGGTFLARGPDTSTDALAVSMRLTAGELVNVTPANKPIADWSMGERLQSLISTIKTNADNATNNMQRIAAAKKIGDTRPIVINVYGVTNPMAFVASEASIKRAVRRAMG